MEEIGISVIIVAHDRREYLKNSIKSVYENTLSKNFFECIVVKNFRDEEIDNMLENYGFINIVETETSLSKKIKRGIEKSRKGILCFLEDDDLFENNKLEHVMNIFKDEDVLMYKNSIIFIDKYGKEVRKGNDAKLILHNMNLSSNNVRKWSEVGGIFNISSMSIRKSTIMEFFDVMCNIDMNLDNFFFYCSASSFKQGKILKDNFYGSRFRIHDSFTGFMSDDPNLFAARKIEFLRKNIKDFSTEGSLMPLSPLLKQRNSNIIDELLAQYSLIDDEYKLPVDSFIRLLRHGILHFSAQDCFLSIISFFNIITLKKFVLQMRRLFLLMVLESGP